MGRKSARSWQQVYFYLALLVWLSGCSLIYDLERRQIIREAMTSGDQLLASGDFAGALKAFENVTEIARAQPPSDLAWYKMGMIQLHPRNPNRDRAQAAGSFGRVISGFPDSSWAEPAQIWIGLLHEAEISGRDLEVSKGLVEESRLEAERNRQALEKSKQEMEKTRQELDRTRQIIEKSRQVDIEIEEKRRVRGR